jgi:thiol-disulfide isomerase/thioredoxin
MSSAILSTPVRDVADEYRYQHFTMGLLFRDLRFRKNSAQPGDAFPSFEITATTGDRLVNSDVFDGKPVMFIFGSMTCPMTASSAPSVQDLYNEFGDRVNFIMLYVREAHPGENIDQAESMEEKLAYTQMLKDFYGIDWTVAADNIHGDLHRALDPKPNSAFLVGSDGTIMFRSLWAADYGALREALAATADGRELQTRQSTRMIVPVARAMGHVQAVMERGGPRAVRDLWIGGLPMSLAGRVATLFRPLAPNQRGVAAVVTLALSMMAVLAIFGSWLIV